MLFAQNLYPTFLRIQAVSEWYHCNLFTFCKVERTLVPICPGTGLAEFKLSLGFIFFYATSMVLQLISNWSHIGLATKLESIFFITFIALGGGLQVSLFPVRDTFARLFRELIGFERQNNADHWRPKTGKIYDAIVFVNVNLYLLSAFVVPVFGTLYFWLKPELNLSLTYFYPDAGHLLVLGWNLFTIICTFRAWMVLAGACCFTVVNIFMITGQCLKGYINLVRFQLSRAFYSNPNQLKLSRILRLYHEIQLIYIYFKITLKDAHQIIVFQLLASLVQVFSFYLIVTLNSSLTLTQWLLVILLGVDAVFFSSFVFGVGAKVFGASQQTVQYFRTSPRIQRDRCLKRFVLGCQVLKIPFGLDGFLESLTPLIFLNLNIQQTVSLILLGSD